MRKSTITALALAAGLTLTACSGDDPEDTTTGGADETTEDSAASDTATEDAGEATATEDTDAATGTAGGGDYAEGACTVFFTEFGPLADRADEARGMLENGEVTDAVAVDTIALLESRIAETAEDADAEVAGLLERVNAPFTQVVEAKNAEGTIDAETGEATLPEIPVEDSAAAQDELETACAG